MITREQIPSVLDHAVYDTQGNKIGDAKHIFLDDVSGRPEWASVKTGMFGGRESFVPIRDAALVEDHLEVPFDKAKVKEAPTVAIDSGGHLSAEEEHRLYEYYEVEWDTAWQTTEQPAAGRTGTGESGAAERSGPAFAESGAEETAEMPAEGEASGMTGEGAGTSREGMPAEGGAGVGAMPPPAGTEGAMPAASGQPAPERGGDFTEAMTRSEEHLHLTTERQAVGRARLRKYVITEEEEQRIPLTHEEVRIEREPITEENRDAALAGPDISEGQHEVVLHADRVVIETETVPVERVRLGVEEKTEQETVRGEVRKERIDVETPEEGPSS
ncbi:DUF2382 domain-containing protein [Streptomyces sp. TS71-3]|uniref:DUF2382 domain-containing protein n=1 Tax=Streptomyces sp. TS71-3 TaxID=2733862 RepID=UPI001BB39382|nr:PRC and DUF2382 domain-containing protein [Streptomyces sp. TS71-3]